MGFWEGKKAIVTGANGFLGSWLCGELDAKGCKAIGLLQEADRIRSLKNFGIEKKISIEEVDIRNAEAVERIFLKHKAEFCFHLAANAIAWQKESNFFDVNVKGSYNVLSACSKAATRNVVLASTAMIYGTSNVKKTSDEDSALGDMNEYAFSKLCMEKIADAFVEAGKIDAAILRTSNIYGGNDQNFTRIVPSTIKALLQGKKPIVHNEGIDEIDLIYVKDVVRAYLLAAENAAMLKGERINICSGKSIKVNSLVNEIVKISGKNIKAESVEKKQPLRKTKLSNKKAKKLLGWQPEYSLKEGLAETFEFYRKYLEI